MKISKTQREHLMGSVEIMKLINTQLSFIFVILVNKQLLNYHLKQLQEVCKIIIIHLVLQLLINYMVDLKIEVFLQVI